MKSSLLVLCAGTLSTIAFGEVTLRKNDVSVDAAGSPAEISFIKHHNHAEHCLHACHALDFVSCSNSNQDNTCRTTRVPTCDEVSAVNAGCGKGCPKVMKDLMHKSACNANNFQAPTLLLETKVVEQIGCPQCAKQVAHKLVHLLSMWFRL